MSESMNFIVEAKNPRKARRISRACDYCHHRSIRCRASSEGDGSRCQNCVDFEQPCTYNRPIKRRGAKVWMRSVSTSTINGSQHGSGHAASRSVVDINCGVRPTLTSPVEPLSNLSLQNNGTIPGHWRAPHVASQAVIMDLVEIYFEVIYPM